MTTALFDHIEHDMLALASAFIDDEDISMPGLHEALPPCLPQQVDIPTA
ncbi:MAG: hypothetical protein ACRYF6_11835 [Janthinobacterium lividum]